MNTVNNTTQQPTDTRKYSIYYQELSKEAKRRYNEKLDMLHLKADPYTFSREEWSSDISFWPEVEYPDIYNYLINTPSPYTKDELKAYKSLEGYKYCTDGWIDQVMSYAIEHGALLTARVRHSQQVSATPVKPWVAAEKSGTIICAHCTCMAGLGEACSHISALLFVLEATTKMKKNVSCTSQLCSWLPPSMQKVEYAPVSHIDFSTPSKKRRSMIDDECVELYKSAAAPASSSKVPKPTQDELNDLYKQLDGIGRRPVLLSILPGYSDKFVPESETGILPPTLLSLFNEEFLELSYLELLKTCEENFASIRVTQQQAKHLEAVTRRPLTKNLETVYNDDTLLKISFKREWHCFQQLFSSWPSNKWLQSDKHGFNPFCSLSGDSRLIYSEPICQVLIIKVQPKFHQNHQELFKLWQGSSACHTYVWSNKVENCDQSCKTWKTCVIAYFAVIIFERFFIQLQLFNCLLQLRALLS